jgi:hypothetical protein
VREEMLLLLTVSKFCIEDATTKKKNLLLISWDFPILAGPEEFTRALYSVDTTRDVTSFLTEVPPVLLGAVAAVLLPVPSRTYGS